MVSMIILKSTTVCIKRNATVETGYRAVLIEIQKRVFREQAANIEGPSIYV